MEIVRSDQAPPPVGPYSQALRFGGLLFVSGQIPLTPEGALVSGGIEEQTHQVLRNLKAILEAGGASLRDVLQTTCYLTDLSEFQRFNDVYAQYFQEPYPARVTVGVAALPRGARVEIACIAQAG
jgi:2-iminobutanoate/2-iminopropanoate deaminase